MPIANYVWDEENLIAETDGGNVVQTVYTNEPQQYGSLISSRIGGSTSYHHFDAIGSTRQLTNVAGTVTDTVIYDAWGNVVSRTGTAAERILWIGELGYHFDPETGNFSVRERPYGPPVGRWTTVDRFRFVTGFALFLYCQNAPVYVVDPSGLAEGPPGSAPGQLGPPRPPPGVPSWSSAAPGPPPGAPSGSSPAPGPPPGAVGSSPPGPPPGAFPMCRGVVFSPATVEGHPWYNVKKLPRSASDPPDYTPLGRTIGFLQVGNCRCEKHTQAAQGAVPAADYWIICCDPFYLQTTINLDVDAINKAAGNAAARPVVRRMSYGHEQRHVECFQQFACQLFLKMLGHAKQHYYDTEQQCAADVTRIRAFAADQWKQFEGAQSSHNTAFFPCIPKSGEPIPPKGEVPPPLQ